MAGLGENKRRRKYSGIWGRRRRKISGSVLFIESLLLSSALPQPLDVTRLLQAIHWKQQTSMLPTSGTNAPPATVPLSLPQCPIHVVIRGLCTAYACSVKVRSLPSLVPLRMANQVLPTLFDHLRTNHPTRHDLAVLNHRPIRPTPSLAGKPDIACPMTWFLPDAHSTLNAFYSSSPPSPPPSPPRRTTTRTPSTPNPSPAATGVRLLLSLITHTADLR